MSTAAWIATAFYLSFSLLTATLDQLLQQENLVIEYWTVKKRKLEQCHQYVLFEQSAKQVRIIISLFYCFGLAQIYVGFCFVCLCVCVIVRVCVCGEMEVVVLGHWTLMMFWWN